MKFLDDVFFFFLVSPHSLFSDSVSPLPPAMDAPKLTLHLSGFGEFNGIPNNPTGALSQVLGCLE